jgi:hypothetical protein
MRQLSFVRALDDGNLLILESADPVEQFVIAAAEVPVAPPAPAPTAAPAPATSPTSAAPAATAAEPVIAPREIQMRVRAGESPAQVAESIGSSLDKVLRFAEPVMDERRRIAGEARRSRARRTNREGADSAVVQFGEAVDQRFGAHGISAADVSWDARRRDDGEWLVTARWTGGAGEHGAEWLFHRGTRTVTPVDDTAADLLSDRPIRPVLPPEPERPALAAAPPLVPGIVAFPPMPDAHTGPIPKVDDVFDQEAPPEGPREVPPLVPAASALNFDEPPLPLGITAPTPHPSAFDRLANRHAAKRDESDDERAARARVPSWDDILLGVRRKPD